MSTRQRLYLNSKNGNIFLGYSSNTHFTFKLGLEPRSLRQPGLLRYASHFAHCGKLAETSRVFTWIGEGSSKAKQGEFANLGQPLRIWANNPWHSRHPTWRITEQSEDSYSNDLSVYEINCSTHKLLVPTAERTKLRLANALSKINTPTSARVPYDRSDGASAAGRASGICHVYLGILLREGKVVNKLRLTFFLHPTTILEDLLCSTILTT